MKYAVLRIKGTQYRVSEGEQILVAKIEGKPEAEVLLVADEGKVKIGKPEVSGVEIKLKVVTELEKGDKIKVFKYRAKSRYRKRIGFRPVHTRLLVEKIS